MQFLPLLACSMYTQEGTFEEGTTFPNIILLSWTSCTWAIGRHSQLCTLN